MIHNSLHRPSQRQGANLPHSQHHLICQRLGTQFGPLLTPALLVRRRVISSTSAISQIE